MNEDPSQASDPQAEPSVFGNLPRTRPGARSPRRDAATTAGAARKATAAGNVRAKKAAAKARPAREPEPPPPDERPEEAPVAEEDGRGLDELAWAGVAAAAEAATLGVRLANRALESLRGGSEEDSEEGSEER